ncbi:MAG TPA: DeoR/GlpR family DNA-binding transcription regulator [Acidothermaceae bacterium]
MADTGDGYRATTAELPSELPAELPLHNAFSEERRAKILEIVASRGRIRTSELAELLGVAEPTVRRDVADLDRQRLVRRTHGGVLALRPAYEPELAARAQLNVPGKRAIADACLALIDDRDSVFLDSGTSIEMIAEALRRALTEGPPGSVPRPAHVTVLTNAIKIAALLSDVPTVRHTVLGGQFRALGGCMVGPLALENLQQFTVNTAFIGVTGLSDNGFSVSDLGDAQLKEAIMDRARRVIVPMDSSKIGADDFRKVCDLDRVQTVVTDQADPWLRAQCDLHGVEVIVAPP